MPTMPTISLGQMATLMVLAIISLVLMLPRDRRVALLGLLGCYVWMATQMRYDIYRPVALVRLGLGALVCLMLYVTAGHVETAARSEGRPVEMNLVFRAMAAVLAGLLAWGIWRRYPLSLVPEGLGLASYWLALDGVIMILMGGEPLAMGLGLMALVCAFEGVYLYGEQGLIATALIGVLDVAIAMAISVLAETGLRERVRTARSEGESA